MSVVTAFLYRVAAEVINPLMLLLTAGATILFLWGVFLFIKNADDESGREEGRRAIMWGIVGLVIIFGVYGILGIALDTAGIRPEEGPLSN